MRACVHVWVGRWVSDLGREGWRKGGGGERMEGGREKGGWKDRAINRVNEYVCVGNLDSHARTL